MKLKICLCFSNLFLSIFLLSDLFAQNEVFRYYELSDTVVVEAEREMMIPQKSTIALKMPLQLQKTPASIGVVPQALLRAQNAGILSDALHNISGINVQQGFGIYDNFYVRGINSLEGSLILTDGTAEPEVSFYNLYNIDRVEVLKGPGAFLYGGNPLSGTVNMVKKKPAFDNDFSLSIGGGSFGAFNGRLDYNIANRESGVAVRLNSVYKKTEMYRDNKANSVFAVNPTMTWALNARSTANLDVEFIRGEHEPDSGIPVMLLENKLPDIAQTTDYQHPMDYSKQTVMRGKLSYDFVLNESVVLQNKFYYTDLEWNSLGTLVTGAAPVTYMGPTKVLRGYSDLDDRQKVVGDQLEARINFSTGEMQHNFLAGLEINRLQDHFTLASGILQPVELQDNPTLASPFFQYGEQTVAAKTTVIAPYFADKISVLPKLDFIIGGRFDRLRFDEPEYNTSRAADQFSPVAGMTISPKDNLSIYASAGKAFAPPSSRIVGERKPEESEQIEAGLKAQLFDKKLNLTAAVYRHDRKNMAIPDESLVLQENGSQRSQGFEAELQAKPDFKTHVFLSYAWNKSEMTEFTEEVQNPASSLSIYDWSGKLAPFAPKHLANLWINRQFTNSLSLGLGARYIGKQYIWVDNLFQLEAARVIDATIAYKIQRLRISVNLKNIGNTRYYEKGFRNYSVIPAFPFTAFTAVELHL